MDMTGHDHFSIVMERGDHRTPLSRAIQRQIDSLTGLSAR
jgi:hypothetical protein